MEIQRDSQYNNYVVVKACINNQLKYGILDQTDGLEYVPIICDDIKFYINAKLVVFSIGANSAFCHIEDFDKYANKLKSTYNY
jgi:hypothetical protein